MYLMVQGSEHEKWERGIGKWEIENRKWEIGNWEWEIKK